MDNLSEIIQTLSSDDNKEFRSFIQRQKVKKRRKDLELYQILWENKASKPAQIIEQLYPNTKNKVAYHAVRKRLLKHLMDFLVFKRLENDTTSASVIMGLHSLSQYLFDHENYRLAWKHLKRAEELGIANEQFELLNSIYNLMIRYGHTQQQEGLRAILARREANKVNMEEEERANIAYSLIKLKLGEHKAGKKNLNFDVIIDQVLTEFNLNGMLIQRPKVLYKVMTIVRTAMIAKKDFYSLEPYLIKHYSLTEKNFGFSKSNHYYKVNLLYMIAHVLYRNKKFEHSIRYLKTLKSCLLEHNGVYYKSLFPKCTLLYAACQNFMGMHCSSIEILEKLVDKNSEDIPEDVRLNALVNLMVYYFQNGNLKQSVQSLVKINHTDGWCEKKMGKEWVLKKNLMEIILQYEMGNIDIVENKIRSFEKAHAKILTRPLYQSVNNFLQVIKKVVQHPNIVHSEEFQKKVRSTLVVKEYKQEDLQSIGFYVWLKAKIVKQPYYDVLLELVNRE